MIKILMIALAASALALSLVGQARALTLTNNGATEQSVKISEGGDEMVSQDIAIAAGQTIRGVCMEGCTIALENGEQQSFEGDEDVYIENGRFVTRK